MPQYKTTLPFVPRSVQRFALLFCFSIVLVYTLALLAAPGQIAFAAGTITGTVFRDYDGDGLQDTREPGVGNITIKAYDSAGTSASATSFQYVCAGNNSPAGLGCTAAGTPALGSYSINTNGLLSGETYRLEMTWTQSFLQNGSFNSASASGNKTSVRFVTGGTSSVNFALSDPSQYVSPTATPRLVTNAYVWGSSSGAAQSAMYSWDYTFNTAPASGATFQGTSESTHAQIGATWGLAYRRSTGILYTSAYLKRLSGFGPGLGGTDGSGTIYSITPNNTGTDNGTAFIDLDTGGDTTGSNLHSTGVSAYICSSGTVTDLCDAAAFANVGKASLGGLKISDDDTKMWTVNLFNKHLIQITFATAAIVDLGTIPSPTCTNGVARPFGLGWKDGKLYMGGVCDESGNTTSVATANLSAYVYSWDPTTYNSLTWTGTSLATNSTQVLTFPLNYNRTCLNKDKYGGALPFCDGPANTIHAPSALWRPWTDTLATIMQNNTTYMGSTGTADRTGGYAQPMLSDIVFDNEDMIIGFRDRTADMLGYNDPGPNSTNPLTNGSPNERTLPGGEILRANPNGSGGWALESNASSNPTGIFSAPGGAGNNEGPGGGTSATRGEFYYEDIGPSATTNHHREASLGGLEQVPGYSEVALTSYSPVNSSTAGAIQLYGPGAAVPGTRERAIQLIGNTGNGDPNGPGSAGNNFSKTNGLGDLEVILLPAPLELGNRVWRDSDGDGIQDGGEAGVSGLTVRLFEGANLIGTTTTDSNGEYYFSSTTLGNWGADGIPNTADDTGVNATNGLKPSTNGFTHNYQIRIEQGQGSNTALTTGYTVTTQNAPQPANGNAAATDNNPVKDIADSDASLSGSDFIINYTTGGIGVNNHGLDFGLAPRFSVGNRVWLDTGTGGGTVNNGIMDGGEVGLNGVTLSLYQDSNGDGVPDGAAVAITTTATSNGNPGYYSFSNLAAGKYLVAVDASNFTAGHPLVGYYSSASTKTGDKADKGLDRSSPGQTTYGILTNTLTFGPTDNAPTGTAETDFASGQTQGGTQNSTTDGRANLQIDFGFQNTTPTAVDFGTLDAAADAAPSVTVKWTTLNELNLVGFNVLRSDSAQGGYAAVNAQLIQALSIGQINGNSYDFRDATVQNGNTYFYRIELVRPDGTTNRTSAVQVNVPAANCPLQAPQVTAPANGVRVKAGKVSFTWNAVPCATSYKWQLRADSAQGALIATKKGLTKTAVSYKILDAGKTYVWRVVACDAAGGCVAGEWSTFQIKRAKNR